MGRVVLGAPLFLIEGLRNAAVLLSPSLFWFIIQMVGFTGRADVAACSYQAHPLDVEGLGGRGRPTSPRADLNLHCPSLTLLPPQDLD